MKTDLRRLLLHRVHRRLRLVIGPTDGSESLVGANDLFAFVQGNIRDFGCGEPSKPTTEMEVELYEVPANGTLDDAFGHFGGELDRVCLTEHQVKKFVRSNRDLFRDHKALGVYATLFLLNLKGEHVVIYVWESEEQPGKFGCGADRLARGTFWYSEFEHHILVPKRS